ncbi:hypothetical protein D9M71_362210 [compost metagenome]
MKDRPLLEDEATGFGAIDFGAGDVGGQKVRCELNSMELRLDAFGQFLDGLGLGQARCAFHEHMAIGQQHDQQAFDEFFLAENLC